MKEFSKSMGIKFIFSSPYHHNTNGMTEWQFRTIRDVINASVKEAKQKDWATILPDMEFNERNALESNRTKPRRNYLWRKICRKRWNNNKNSQQRNLYLVQQDLKYPTNRSLDIGGKKFWWKWNLDSWIKTDIKVHSE